MCHSLSELKLAVKELLAGFDPALLPGASLPEVIADAGAVAKMMSTLAALCSAHCAAIGPTKSAPKQAARELAQRSGISLSQAERTIASAQLLPAQPELSAAARSGELSSQQLNVIATAVERNPHAAGRLLERARTASLQELSDEASRAVAEVEDTETRENAIQSRRSLRQWRGLDGAWHLYATGAPADGAKVMAAINAFADRAFKQARQEGRRERPEAYAFDGLVSLATAGGATSPRTDLLVRVDLDVFMRGYPVEGEICEVSGVGPISAKAAATMASSGSAFLKAIVTKGKDVVGVVHLGRQPNAHQKSALDWLYPYCAAEGCGTRAAHLQSDHRLDWSKSHVTLLKLLDRLCAYHHRLKTEKGWALVHGTGKRAFIPPDDPRHPRFSPMPYNAELNKARGSSLSPSPNSARGTRTSLEPGARERSRVPQQLPLSCTQDESPPQQKAVGPPSRRQ
jgi:hypothetical protein